uniref:NADH-ubiquinone oxidoreductase chain 5 n=1 Tax=Ophiomastix mixta TaxID=2705303 RepID=A0A6C0FJH7_9ECHI|nr:NADH dehydrogenase subunit 5 [Ophiomastix mixta]QHT54190.1 NADH dehydrogenase subunit 5 [Ophiomastix mixta]
MIFSLTPLLAFVLFLLFTIFLINTLKSYTQTRLLLTLSVSASIILSVWVWSDMPKIIVTLQWWFNHLNGFSLSFCLDTASVLFTCVALIVTWSIIEFTQYYMASDPNKALFQNTLILFLLLMLVLVTANNLFTLFIGWEGVGILSFILIGWWFSRNDANSAAIQAILYNRIGDIGLIAAMALSIFYYNTWNINEIQLQTSTNPLNTLICLGFILAAIGKSAQFGLHAWLPSAMEGPTPVSALLHSSTMVVAGIFLLYRTANLFPSWALSLICMIGSLTAIFAASVALFQFDIKKIIAYSTTSQLGLMAIAIGIGANSLALFHICTHAFFKALLFLCSGSIIHQANNEQDLRKIGNYSSLLPFTTSAIIIGSLALSGTPFLGGFYSKDLILEHINTNTTNSVSIFLGLIATLMTSAYSARLIYYLNTPNTFIQPINPLSENLRLIFWPLTRLIFGAIIAGWIISLTLFNYSPLIIIDLEKLAPLILTIIGIVIILTSLNTIGLSPAKIPQLFTSTWFFVNISHPIILFLSFSNSLIGVLRTGDYGWLSLLGGYGIASTTRSITRTLNNAFSGNLLSYFTISFLSILIAFAALFTTL